MNLFRNLSPLATGAVLSVATLLLAAIVSTVHPPLPSVHDEFSYLLAADTFANGRLSNPTPECWQSFESYHIIMQPSYASKYPPLQGLLLATGQVVWGEPIAGVWLTSALATACCYWMLLGWMPRRWADLTTLALVFHPSIQLLWGQSFWGGTAAFAAGALVWGAVPRLQRMPCLWPAIAMAVGASLLAISRPYEGLVAVVVAALLVVSHWLRHDWPRWSSLVSHVVLPQAAILSAALTLIGIYNNAVTGSPLTMPYMVHEETYAMSPNFVGQSPYTERTYRHATMERFHREWAMGWFDRQDTLPELFAMKRHTTWVAATFFFTLPLALPLLLFPWWRGRTIRQVLVALAAGWAASMVTIWSWPHYMAPTAPLLLVLLGWSLRNLSAVVYSRLPALRGMLARVPIAALPVAMHALLFAGSLSSWLDQPQTAWQYQRARLAEVLAAKGGQHLVLVRYSVDHPTLQEWVYNEANLEAANVLWAREADAVTNSQLIQQYRDRQCWLVQPSAHSLRFEPYAERVLSQVSR